MFSVAFATAADDDADDCIIFSGEIRINPSSPLSLIERVLVVVAVVDGRGIEESSVAPFSVALFKISLSSSSSSLSSITTGLSTSTDLRPQQLILFAFGEFFTNFSWLDFFLRIGRGVDE